MLVQLENNYISLDQVKLKNKPVFVGLVFCRSGLPPAVMRKPSKNKQPYVQKFRKEWESDPPELKEWIQPVPGDETSARCLYCSAILKAHFGLLVEHKKTKKHEKSAAPLSTASRQLRIPFQSVPRPMSETSVAEAGMALLVTCHSAIRNSDHLTNLSKRLFSSAKGVNGIKLGRTKCAALIKNVLAPYFVRDLQDDIGDGWYS